VLGVEGQTRHRRAAGLEAGREWYAARPHVGCGEEVGTSFLGGGPQLREAERSAGWPRRCVETALPPVQPHRSTEKRSEEGQVSLR